MHASGYVLTQWEDGQESREEAAFELERIGKDDSSDENESVSQAVLKAVGNGADGCSSQQKLLWGSGGARKRREKAAALERLRRVEMDAVVAEARESPEFH